jgi:prepilin-type N-terminal cleavage/methylation domain-containing protein
MKRGFTLIELLVVIAIIAILAAILFPVFAQARNQAKKTQAQSNFNQIGKAMEMYKSDNGQKYPMGLYVYGPLNHLNNRVWGQLVQPYTKNWDVFADPVDSNQGITNFQTDHSTGSKCPAATLQLCQQFWQATVSNVGINMDYIMPVITDENGNDLPVGIKDTRNQAPSKCILAVDSVWDRDSTSGQPKGGGSFLVDPPAEKFNGNSTFPYAEVGQFSYGGGWFPSKPKAWNVYGGVWPWHLGGGQAVVIFTDTHVKTLTIPQLVDGCTVSDGFGGAITDRDRYLWDLQ